MDRTRLETIAFNAIVLLNDGQYTQYDDGDDIFGTLADDVGTNGNELATIYAEGRAPVGWTDDRLKTVTVNLVDAVMTNWISEKDVRNELGTTSTELAEIYRELQNF